MQQAERGQLRRAKGSERRETIRPIYNGTEAAKQQLLANISHLSAEEAIVVLGRPDVTVTDQADKDVQLAKLSDFTKSMQEVNNSVDGVRLVFSIERAVGPKPEQRDWRDEWADAWMERAKIDGQDWTRAMFESGGMVGVGRTSRRQEGGSVSVEATIRKLTDEIQRKVDAGWPRDQAEAYTLITAYLPVPLTIAVRERSDRYAASTHVVCEVLAERARRVTTIAPPVYWNLTGKLGLATEDATWGVLAKDGVEVGLSLVTDGRTRALVANERNFSDSEGYRVAVNKGGNQTFQLQDSDVVCLRSSGEDEDGYHSLINIGGTTYDLPPLATVTLEKIDMPGTWEILGHRPKRRLYTVSVTFKEPQADVALESASPVQSFTRREASRVSSMSPNRQSVAAGERSVTRSGATRGPRRV